MDRLRKARALALLARELDFGRATNGEPLTSAEWRLLLEEAARLVAGSAGAAEPPHTAGETGKERRPAGPKPPFPGATPVLYVDGASRGNPGPAAAGAVLRLGAEKVGELSRYLGTMTNNQAEYQALLLGLALVERLGYRRVEIRSDSELMVRQLKGRYKVKNVQLQELFNRARAALNKLEAHDIIHIDRAYNAEADRLANMALDERAL